MGERNVKAGWTVSVGFYCTVKIHGCTHIVVTAKKKKNNKTFKAVLWFMVTAAQ